MSTDAMGALRKSTADHTTCESVEHTVRSAGEVLDVVKRICRRTVEQFAWFLRNGIMLHLTREAGKIISTLQNFQVFVPDAPGLVIPANGWTLLRTLDRLVLLS